MIVCEVQVHREMPLFPMVGFNWLLITRCYAVSPSTATLVPTVTLCSQHRWLKEPPEQPSLWRLKYNRCTVTRTTIGRTMAVTFPKYRKFMVSNARAEVGFVSFTFLHLIPGWWSVCRALSSFLMQTKTGGVSAPPRRIPSSPGSREQD